MDCLCRPSRIMAVRINLLDETDFVHEIKDDLPGQALLDVVFARLNLIETSYFGIRYIDEENQTHWLDPASRISRQLKPKSDPFDLYFGVKFYTADPCKLLEEITRYQLFLQVKQDVLQGRLPVSFELAAELGAFVVQSELGDYDQRRHSKGYVSEFRLLPSQSSELETRVAELHQQLKGMSPATAELNYLDKVKWHDMYGVDLHPVLGEDSVEYFLGLTPSGIVVLRNKTTVAHYYWPRIAKVYYKGRYFMLRISDKNNELSTYGFETPRKAACKHLWRCCVEHHAFFRLVRVAPLPTSQSTTSDLFQLGSRLRYSGRTEKQAAKDALSIGRTPPAFTRIPSKRQPRRVIDDFLSGGKNVEGFKGGAASGIGGTLGRPSVIGVQPTSSTYESPYHSTYSVPSTLGIRPYHHTATSGSNYHSSGGNNNTNGGSNSQTPDSPRSTRSAPWPRTQQRSLFGNKPSSPRSVRSASTAGGAGHHHHQHQHQPHHQQQAHRHQAGGAPASTSRYRSSSVESHSSNDSRSTRRNKHRHRRTSDNESELSRGSGRSGRSHHRKHRRSRHRRDSAGSDHESSRGRSYSGHRVSAGRSGSAELIDSTSQWREVQRRQAEASLGQSSVQQASVSKSSMVARSLHSNDSHSDTHSHHKSRRHRKNKSPSDRNRIWSSELAKHLQFDLVDTAGMTEDQLREIPYTVVETNSKRSASNLKIHKSSSKSSVGARSNGSGNTLTNGSGGGRSGAGGAGGHSVGHGGGHTGSGSGTGGGQGKNRVDRIRGLYFQSSNPNDSCGGGGGGSVGGGGGGGAKNGSIRSASTISSRECDRTNGLVRMMSSMSMGDFISPTGSNLSPLENNSALRVSHEHTDSGLGADQDYAYSSERSSDSTRYGTNKSSGASSGSHRKAPCGGGSNAAAADTYGGLMHHQQQQTVSSQQQQQQQQQRQNSFYGPRHQQQQQPLSSSASFKYATNHGQAALAPVHHPHAAPLPTNPNPHPSPGHGNGRGNGNNNGNGGDKNNPLSLPHPHSHSHSANNNNNNNRLLNYTTFENNQYKFSLNNVFGGGGGGGGGPSHLDSFLEMPHAAAPYYYNGPPSAGSAHVKRRDAKSDIGVPTRRSSGKALTKTQLLTGQAPGSGGGGGGSGCYPLASPSYGGGGLAARLHPAKSDLFLSYLHSSAGPEYERPHIYNYKMPQMPEFLRPQQQQQQQQNQQQQQQGSAAYHISGAQTADLPPLFKPSGTAGSGVGGLLYAGAAPSNDVVYYQFDNGQHAPVPAAPAPVVQQPKAGHLGPLVFLQHGPGGATSTASAATASTAAQQTVSTASRPCMA